MKKLWGAILMASVLLSFTGCGQNESEEKTLENHDFSNKNIGYQLENPSKGEEIAIVSTDSGEFKIRFFPDKAPKAVENFKELSKKGYYNNVTFHRVIKDFMIQGGDPQGTGMGGESIWGKDFEDEFSGELFNITGSLSMANRGPNTNGSQFFINNQNPQKFPGWSHFENSYLMYKKNPDGFNRMYGGTLDMSKITDDIKKLYTDNGGNPSLDGYFNTAGKGHTVFGQVFEGKDILNKISATPTNQNDKPLEDIKIKKIDICAYK